MQTFVNKHLIKTITTKSKDLLVNAYECAVDLIKASAFIPKGDNGVHILADMFEPKLIEAWFGDAGQLPKLDDGTVNHTLASTFIKYSFLRDQNKALKTLVMPCLEGTLEQKLVACKALLALIGERNPDNAAPLVPLYSKLINPLLTLYQETMETLNTPEKDEKKKKAASTQKRNYALEVVDTILHIFCVDPMLFLTPSTTNDTNDQRFSNLVESFVETRNPIIMHQCARLFRKLFLDMYITKWSPQVLTSFLEISSMMFTRLSQALLESEENSGYYVTIILSLLRSLVYRTKQFYAENGRGVEEVVSNRKRLQSLEMLASNLLICLCSPDREIWKTTTKCFRDICDQIEILQNQDLKYLNYSFYRQLSGVDVTGDHATERKTQIQLFRRVEIQTKSNLTAFNIIYKRWKDLMKDGKDKDQFATYTALLCGLGGCVLQQTQDKKAAKANASKKRVLDDDNSSKLDDFINDLLEAVTSSTIKQIVTQSLATDLAPALYDKVFATINEKIKKMFVDGAIKITKDTNMFVEQVIYILKTILESKEAAYDLALVNDFDSLLLIVAQYTARTLLDLDGVHLKGKYCYLIEAAMSKAEYISFTDAIAMRAKLLSSITEWLSEFKGEDIAQDVKMALRDLDFIALRAFAALLNGHVMKHEAVDDFYKHFAFLESWFVKTRNSDLRQFVVKALEYLLYANVSAGLQTYMEKVYNPDEDLRSTFLMLLASLLKKDLTQQRGDEDNHDQQAAESVTDKYEDMCNLLHDFDLQVLFALFESVKNNDKDEICEAIVRIFMKKGETALLNVLHQSVVREVKSTLQAETLFRANSTASKLMKKFCQRVAVPYLKKCIGGLIKQVSDNPKNFEIDPPKAKARNEDPIQNAKNCIAVIQQFFDAILQSKDYMPFAFREYCRYLYEEVGSKFALQKTEADDLQFDFKYIAVGGFIFLRLICPAITTPNQYGLEIEPGNDARRFFIIITKVLQNLANGIVSNKKEEFMVHFEPWLQTNIPTIKQFFEDIAKPAETIIPIEDEVKDEELEEGKAVTHRFVFNYAETMRPTIQQLSKKEQRPKKTEQPAAVQPPQVPDAPVPEEMETVEVNAYNWLAAVLEKLGKPQDADKKAAKVVKKGGEDAFSSIVLTEFVTKMSNMKDIDAQLAELDKTEVFYQKGNNRSNKPVFYFNPAKFENKDTLLYHIVKKLENNWKSPYALLIDCTSWDEKQEIPFQQFLKLQRILPKGAKKNLKNLYVYNANAAFKNHTKKLAPLVKKGAANIQFFFSSEELNSNISQENTHLPEKTLAFEKDLAASYADVQRVINANKVKESIVKLGNDNLVNIISNDTVLGYETKSIEVIPLSSIAEVGVKKALLKSSKNEFFVRYEDDKHWYLRSEQKDQMIQAIKSAIARKALQTNVTKMKSTKALKPEDVPGQLLNICFLNLESSFPRTRFAAFNLLTSVAVQIGFAENKLLPSDIVAVPRNTEDLVCELSSKIGKARPNLTLEFLLEALKGFEQVSPKSQIMCVKYVIPWIPNLVQYIKEGIEEKQQKLKQLFDILAKLTCTCHQAFPAVSDVWKSMTLEPVIATYCIDAVLSFGVQKGPYDETTFPQLCDLVVSLGHHASKALVARILDMILEILEAINNPSAKIELTDATLPKIIVLIRYLMALSFQNNLHLSESVPRVFHVLTLLVGIGNSVVRAAVHTTLINILHSLSMDVPAEAKEQKQKLASLNAKLVSAEFVAMFLGRKDIQTDPFGVIKEEPNISVAEPITSSHIERVVIFMVEVIAAYTSSTAWLGEWANICKTSIVSGNLVLFPRTLTAFAIVASPDQSANMIPSILGFLGKLPANSLEASDAAVSIMLSLVHLFNKLDVNDPNTATLAFQQFLLGILMIPNAKEELVNAIVGVMLCVLNILYESQELAKYQSLGHFFNTCARDSKYEDVLSKFEGIVGVSFKDHFSFALSVLLMKAVVSVKTRERTISFLKQLLIVSNKLQFFTAHSLGFICALIPFEKQYHSTLYCEHLFQKEIFEHPKQETVFLYQKYLFSLVSEVQSDSEKIAIYTTLMRGFDALPDTFADVFKDHHSMSHVVKAYAHGANDSLIECALNLFKSMSRNKKKQGPLSTKEPFEDCGFKGFREHIQFKKTKPELHDMLAKFLKQHFQSEVIGVNKKEQAKPQPAQKP